MSRSICFLLFCLCTLPVAAYSADDTKKEHQITKEKLQCLYEHSGRLLSRPTNRLIIQLSEKCDDFAVKAGNSGASRGSKENVQPSVEQNVDVLTLTSEQLRCFRKAYEKLDLDERVGPKTLLRIEFTDNCTTESST